MKFKYFETESGKTLMTAHLMEDKTISVTVKPDGEITMLTPEGEDGDSVSEMLLKFEFIDPVTGDKCFLIEDESYRKELTTGQFDVDGKFKGFINIKGRARIHQNSAFINIGEFSGMYDGITMKLTICDDKKVNLEEIDSDQIDDSMKKRFLDDVITKKVQSGGGGVFSELALIASYKFVDKDSNRLYLEVETIKPIDKLKNLFEEDTKMRKVSETGMGFLNSLLGDLPEEELPVVEENNDVKEEVSVKEVSTEILSTYDQMMKDSFTKMNRDKIEELTSKIGDKQNALTKCKYEISRNERLFNQLTEDYRVLNSRLESLSPFAEPNGYVFFISESKKNTDDIISEDDMGVLSKISPALGVDVGKLAEFLKKEFHVIKIAKKDYLENTNLTPEIFKKISNLDPAGSLKPLSGEFNYTGDLNWHQLTDKMLRFGFEQSPEFDEKCGSNSYKSEKKEEESNQVI